jgi:hypothetical protein
MSDAPLIEITLRDVEVISKSSGGDELHLLDIRGSVLGFPPSSLSFAIFIDFCKNQSHRVSIQTQPDPCISFLDHPAQLVSWAPRAQGSRRFSM